MKNILSTDVSDILQPSIEDSKFKNLIFDCDKKIEEEKERKKRIKESWEDEDELKFIFIRDVNKFVNPNNIKNVVHDLHDIIHLDGTPIMEKIYSYSYGMLFYNFKTWFTYYGRSLYRTKFGWFVKSNKWSTIYRSTGLFDALKYMYKYRKYNN